jgi:hypothetical protein
MTSWLRSEGFDFEAGVEPLPDGLEYHVCFGSERNLRVSEIWDSREQFEAYGKQLSVIAGDGRHPLRFRRPSRDLRGSQAPQALGNACGRARLG